jgi:hypothetical protein
MWGSWTVALVGLLAVGALVLSFAFVGPLLFGIVAVLVIGGGLLLAAGVRRAAEASDSAGAGLTSSPGETNRFGEGAKDRGAAAAPRREEAR